MAIKRSVDSIDLTEDSPNTFSSSSQPYAPPDSSQGYAASQPSSSKSQARHAKRPAHDPGPVPGGSQAHPITVFEDEEGTDEEVEESQRDAQYGYELYGVKHTKIVGVRFYQGYATIGEMCILRREPHNTYDRNAIQALNVQGTQIGHIPRQEAAKLARYMDNGSLQIEAVITGHKGHFDCPLELRMYGTSESVARENLIAQMRADKLEVGQAMSRKRMQEKQAKERQKLAAQAARQAKKKGEQVVPTEGIDVENYTMGGFAGGSSQGGTDGPSLQEIMMGSERFTPRNMENVIEEFGVKEADLEKMPMAPQPEAICTTMHPFQLQGLQWMLDKESPQLPARGTHDVVQLWKRHNTMPNAFTNVATNYSVNNPDLASGAILADDMGLGKTLQVISLIMADRALGRRSQGVSDASLILAPVSVMSNWSTQIAKHVKDEYALRVMFYHGNRKEPVTPKSIDNYDVVITTYASVSSEWHSQKSTTVPRKSGLFSVTWRRVILDEGHSIRNPKTKQSVAAANLLAQSRWVLTGTPIINNLRDLYSLVRFLRLSGGLTTLEIFHGAIIRPVQQGDEKGNRALQMLMGSVCLRRKKEMKFVDLRLPDLEEYVHKVTLLPHEQEKYDAFSAQATGTLELYRNKAGGSDTYAHILEIMLRMRQVCNHWKMVGDERLDEIMKQLEAEGAVDLTEGNKFELQKLLQFKIDMQESCPVCLEEPCRDPVITKCGHVFCLSCIERVIETQHKCPNCRAELGSLPTTTVKPAKELVAPPPLTQEQLREKESLEDESSSKVDTLVSILKASARDPANKTIVFSQWTSFLDLLQPHLANAEIKFTRIDGSMTAINRDKSLEEFDNDPFTTVMLASLSVCSVGLNLVAANQVIMSDSWWAPAIEDQAVDRVHRLGQKRKTTVFRLVVEGSIEERVLGIQEDKRKLMSLAFHEKEVRKGKRTGGATFADLERLLGGGSSRNAIAAVGENGDAATGANGNKETSAAAKEEETAAPDATRRNSGRKGRKKN